MGLDSWRRLEGHVRPDFRKAVVFGLLALAALIAGVEVGGVRSVSLRGRLIAYGCALLLAVFGWIASRTAAREVHRIAVARSGEAAGTPLRLLVLLTGYLLTLFSIFDLIGFGLEHLLVGGAVTGIIVGLAAQPVLGNLFAGLVLIFARPYVPGQRVRVLSGAINGPHVGVIVSAGLLYSVLETADGPLNIPNSTLLASAVGPSAEEEADEEPVPAPSDAAAPADQSAAVIADAEIGLQTGDRKHPEQ